jgi:serine/threonine protein kinase
LIKEADPDLETGYWETASREVIDIISRMLEKDPKERISVDDALKHPYFAKYKIIPTFINGEN